MNLRLVEANFTVVPAFFPFSHCDHSGGLRRQHGACFRLTSSSGGKVRHSLQSAVISNLTFLIEASRRVRSRTGGVTMMGLSRLASFRGGAGRDDVMSHD